MGWERVSFPTFFISLPYLVEHAQLPRGIQVVSQIRSEVCNGCGICYTACQSGRHNAISLVEGLPQVIMNKCIGCGICRAICSLGAISLVRPTGELAYHELLRI